MPYSLTLPLVIAGAAGVAALGGVVLGHSAIADINPAHFHDASESQFYSDLAPNRRADWGSVSADEYRQQASAPPPAAAPNGCVGCTTWPANPRPSVDPAVARELKAAWREARAPVPQVRYVEEVVYEAPPRPDPVPERVRRYARYPVMQGEAPPPPPPDWAEPDDEGDAATR